MKWILVGHRGVGKSELLKRLQKYNSDKTCGFYDLDFEIELAAGKSISEIFRISGEKEFRKLELSVLRKLSESGSSMIVAAGAGLNLEVAKAEFSLAQLSETTFIWVRRETDKLGRIFVDRPRLDSNVSRLDEYDQRYRLREKLYSEYSDVTYEMPEGIDSENAIEKKFFFDRPDTDAIVTIQDSVSLALHNNFVNFSEIEFRTDLNGKNNFLKFRNELQKCRKIVSFRNADDIEFDPTYDLNDIRFDWALELGKPPQWLKPNSSNIVSLHSVHSVHSEGSLAEYENQFHLKYSPFVNSFNQLYAGYIWQQQNPENRSFLPRSDDGSWMWFRQFMKGRQKINFVSPGIRSANDQPSIYKWLATKSKVNFAAVLGFPIVHSRTPIEHQDFFAEKNLNCFGITIKAENFSEDFKILSALGLKAAAVTAPLKKKAFEISTQKSLEAELYQSANTLLSQDQKWRCHNTDGAGFLNSVAGESREVRCLVWGGGGTLEMLKTAFPDAVFLSASTGQPRDFSERLPADFRKQKWTLIWAAEPTADLPEEFTFSKVIDLNYTEYSKARDVAAIQNIPYVGGLAFFKAQAKLQRLFWENNL